MYVHAPGSTYEVLDGIRRSKAAWLAGHEFIEAIILAPDGSQLGESPLPIDALLTNRDAIPRITRSGEARWSRAVGGFYANPLPFPPILVQIGNRGLPVENIDFDFGDVP